MVEVNLAALAAGNMTTKKCTLRRTETDYLGTFGVLTTPSGLQIYIAEKPWRKNVAGKSCIKAGTYTCEWLDHPKHGPCYELKNVPGRSAILIHAGNFVGDEDRGLKSNSEGCLIPGRAIGEIGGQKAVINSRDALNGLLADLEKETFVLVIEWAMSVSKEAYT